MRLSRLPVTVHTLHISRSSVIWHPLGLALLLQVLYSRALLQTQKLRASSCGSRLQKQSSVNFTCSTPRVHRPRAAAALLTYWPAQTELTYYL